MRHEYECHSLGDLCDYVSNTIIRLFGPHEHGSDLRLGLDAFYNACDKKRRQPLAPLKTLQGYERSTFRVKLFLNALTLSVCGRTSMNEAQEFEERALELYKRVVDEQKRLFGDDGLPKPHKNRKDYQRLLKKLVIVGAFVSLAAQAQAVTLDARLRAGGAASAAPLFFAPSKHESHPVGTLMVENATMDDYLIGAGALLTAGPESSITGATLHAQTDRHFAETVKAAVIDFESAHPAELSRIIAMISGSSRGYFQEAVVEPLLERRECSLAEVIRRLGQAAGTREVHLFARWSPDAQMDAELAAAGVAIVIHPLESIEQAALVCGQRVSRWRSGLRAA